MSVAQVVEGRFGLDVSDGEVCAVCAFLSGEGGVVKGSRKRLERPGMRIFRGLAWFGGCCAHIFCVRELIFLPHSGICQRNVQSNGRLFSMFLWRFGGVWGSGSEGITESAIGRPFFDIEEGPLELG